MRPLPETATHLLKSITGPFVVDCKEIEDDTPWTPFSVEISDPNNLGIPFSLHFGEAGELKLVSVSDYHFGWLNIAEHSEEKLTEAVNDLLNGIFRQKRNIFGIPSLFIGEKGQDNFVGTSTKPSLGIFSRSQKKYTCYTKQ